MDIQFWFYLIIQEKYRKHHLQGFIMMRIKLSYCELQVMNLIIKMSFKDFDSFYK